MSLPVLPAKYYLSHFFELLEILDSHYRAVMEPSHQLFIEDFRALSEDAQCTYVRMVNRKGVIFDRRHFFKYKEISDPADALKELELLNFSKPIAEEDKKSVAEFLKKPDLYSWLTNSGIRIKSSSPRDELLNYAYSHLNSLDLEALPLISNLLTQERAAEIEYLLFLYFGKIQKSLNLYTLRDLGIRSINNSKLAYKPRYTEITKAADDYYLSKSFQSLETLDSEEILLLLERCLSMEHLAASTRALRDQVLMEIGVQVENDKPDMALEAWGACKSHPARERQARLLYKIGRRDRCQEVLEAIIKDPWTDEELLFAEDFLARKFGGKKVGYLTEALNQAKEISLSDAYYKKPEAGVRDYYQRQGFDAHFTENYLWTALFGLIFWEELFESDKSAVYNPFDRTPADLVRADFYENHKSHIERKISLLKTPPAIEIHILKMVSLHYGKLNGIFRWSPQVAPIVLDFVKRAQYADLGLILRTMAQKYELYCSGYPDLMLIDKDKVKFIEVKAEGDALRAGQLSKARLLAQAGFDVEILKVCWQVDPQQVYVVVDVETTGGSSQFHRLTEIGAVKVRAGEIIDQFHSLINPARPIPEFISKITGITDEMVKDAPSFAEIVDGFYEFTKDAIFVAHNARFDYGFIQKEFQRLGRGYVRPLMCTVQGMRRQFPGLNSYSLKSLTEHFSISLDQHHRALCDARAAAELLLLINGKRKPKESIELFEAPFSEQT